MSEDEKSGLLGKAVQEGERVWAWTEARAKVRLLTQWKTGDRGASNG